MLEKFNPVNTRTIRDMVYEVLRQAIFKGELKTGDRLVEKELAEKLRVSRTPVREAFRKLEMEGLIRHYPRKGVVVHGITAEDIVEIYAIREALESAAIDFIIKNITPEEKQKLYQLIEKMKRMIDVGDNEELFRASQLFNDILIRSSRMSRLIGLIGTYQEYLARFRRVTMSGQARKLHALCEHEEILRAVAEKDAQRAKQRVAKHLQAACRECLRIFGEG